MAGMNVHRFARAIPALAAAAALALAGCERLAASGAALAAANPLRGLEARCAALPAAHVEVVTIVGEVTERYDVPYATLTERQTQDHASHRTVGLTEVELRHSSAIELTGIEDDRGRTCVRPSVRVELSASPIVVYVAREYHGDSCREPEIRAHEYRHVDVYRRYVAEAAPRLEAALRARLGDAPHYGSDAQAVQRELDTAIRDALSRFMAESEAELARRNAAIDAPEESENLARTCG